MALYGREESFDHSSSIKVPTEFIRKSADVVQTICMMPFGLTEDTDQHPNPNPVSHAIRWMPREIFGLSDSSAVKNFDLVIVRSDAMFGNPCVSGFECLENAALSKRNCAFFWPIHPNSQSLVCRDHQTWNSLCNVEIEFEHGHPTNAMIFEIATRRRRRSGPKFKCSSITS